jgi:hypothetical protein
MLQDATMPAGLAFLLPSTCSYGPTAEPVGGDRVQRTERSCALVLQNIPIVEKTSSQGATDSGLEC